MRKRTTTPLDVLVVESHQRIAYEAEATLLAAGHRAHRCHGRDDLGFPCRAITDPGSCPIDAGIDVALLVRQHVMPRPTPLEVGVNCAIRAGIPIVEKGPAALDPYDRWLTLRSDGEDIVGDVVTAAQWGLDPLREEILRQIGSVMPDDRETEAIECRFERNGRDLVVHLSGPPLPEELTQAMAVRAIDAIGRSARSYDRIDVTYHAVTP
jgi:hypothetical protein